MKKYLIPLLAMFVILAPNVKADSTQISDPLDCFSIAQPSETKNIFSNTWGTKEKTCGYVNSNFYSHSNFTTERSYYCINNFIEVDSSTTYTLTHFNNQLSPAQSPSYNYIYLFDSNFKQVFMKQNWFSPPFTFTTTDDSKYFLYCFYGPYNFSEKLVSDWSMQLEKGSISSIDDLSYEEYKVKSTTPDQPDTPVTDATLDGFYSIYLDRLGVLVDYVSQNKIMLSFIGIILLFVCLEIFLQLFFINGRRRMR